MLDDAGGDVDNYAKCMLDVMQGTIVYSDDKRVVLLNVLRILDDNCDCMGRIDVSVKRVDEQNVQSTKATVFSTNLL